MVLEMGGRGGPVDILNLGKHTELTEGNNFSDKFLNFHILTGLLTT